mmetsp:Transcript_50331/g.126325  ORF Transcript_50331/g.126325 Transcript_50331/m.126325 type:complete len:314 (+) Transcript_50331:41-982(+)
MNLSIPHGPRSFLKQRLPAAALRIARLQARHDGLGAHRYELVVHSLRGNARALGDDVELLRRDIGDTQVGQGGGEANFLTEGIHLVDLRLGFVGQEKGRQAADRHLLAMHVLMALGQLAEAVVDGVAARQTAALKPQPAQQRVGLHNMLVRGRDNTCLVGHLRQLAVLYQRVVATLCQRVRGHGAGQGAVARGVGGVLDHAALRLQPRGQRVTHSGNEEAGRRLHGDVGVHQHDVRVLGQVQVAHHLACGRVDDGARGAGRVGGGDGGDDDDGHLEVESNRLGRVHGLATPEADGGVNPIRLAGVHQALDLVL